MSRIGNKLINVPANVTVEINGSNVAVKGPKGNLNVTLNHGISATMENNIIQVKRINDEKQIKQNHGTSRANLANAIIGVSEGFKKVLEMRGIGFKAAMNGNNIVLYAGYSHTVTIVPDEGAKISFELNKANQTIITVEGCDKQAVGQTAARIREVRRPEPYLGKGIRYSDEHITLKEGKRASSGK